MYNHFYNNGYSGAWSWQLLDQPNGHCKDPKEDILDALFQLSDSTEFGKIDIDLHGKQNTFNTKY